MIISLQCLLLYGTVYRIQHTTVLLYFSQIFLQAKGATEGGCVLLKKSEIIIRGQKPWRGTDLSHGIIYRVLAQALRWPLDMLAVKPCSNCHLFLSLVQYVLHCADLLLCLRCVTLGGVKRYHLVARGTGECLEISVSVVV